MRRVWVAMVVIVAFLLASCDSGSMGARVVADAKVLDTGAVEIGRVASIQPHVTDALLASPIYRITSPKSELPAPVELRLDAPEDSRWIVYYDQALDLWIPVSTERDGKELVARIDHLSDWSTIKGGVDWLSLQLFRLTGNRTDPPQCAGQAPSWVSSFDTEPGDHPRLLACNGGKQEQATITLKNNRGYPFWVSFSDGAHPVMPSHVKSDFPTSFEELLRVGFGAVLGAGQRTYLGPGKQLEATFAQPAAPPKTGRVEARPTWDPSLLGFHTLLGFLGSRGLVDLPIGGGKLLGVKALECYVKVPWASISLTDPTRLLETLEDLRKCFADTVNEEVKRLQVTRPNDPNLKRLKGLSRLLWAVEVTNWTQQILDSVLLASIFHEQHREAC